MKKIYELALVGGGITNKNVFSLIDAMSERHQENAVLIVTGNFQVPEYCVKGFSAEVIDDNKRIVKTVEWCDLLQEEVRVIWFDGDGHRLCHYYHFDRWEEILKKSKQL